METDACRDIGFGPKVAACKAATQQLDMQRQTPQHGCLGRGSDHERCCAKDKNRAGCWQLGQTAGRRPKKLTRCGTLAVHFGEGLQGMAQAQRARHAFATVLDFVSGFQQKIHRQVHVLLGCRVCQGGVVLRTRARDAFSRDLGPETCRCSQELTD